MKNEIKGKLKSQELADKICELIISDKLRADDPILSENRLAQKFGLSRITVRQAIADLVEKDILYKIKGKGTFVAKGAQLPDSYTQVNGFEKTIALILSNISNSYDSNIARGIGDIAKEKGFHVLLRNTDNSIIEEEKALKCLLDSGIRGIIVSPAESNPISPLLKWLCLEFDNIVIINDIIFGVEPVIVSSDDAEGGYIATKHLLEQGHRKIAHLRGPLTVMNAHDRETGYKRALVEAGIAVNSDLILGRRSYAPEEACENMLKLMKLPESERPTAVFAASDDLALGVYQAAELLGFKIPDDIALIGYGHLEKTDKQGHHLSTIGQNGYEIGKLAGEALLNKIISPKLGVNNRHKILVPTELIIKESSLTQLKENLP